MTPTDPTRRRVDALLVESADELFEYAPCGYLATLPDGTLVRANSTFAAMVGVGRDQLLSGTKLQRLLTVGSRIYYETHYAPLLRMQGFANEVSLEIVRADGRVLPVILNARERREPDGTPLFNRITLFDSTDRRRYEQELLLAQRKAEQIAQDKAALLAMLSHDIRNPLNALMGVVQLLDRGDLTDQQRRHVRLLKSSSENMLALLNHVLELSKAESSSFALIETAFSLRELIADVASTFEVPARAKHLPLDVVIGENVPFGVIGDPVAIRQILTNLVGNAVKFTSAGAVTLTVRAIELATHAVTLGFAVSDTGIGIEAEVIERIFAEFTQASSETAERFGGSGLGLTITRRLLALYGSSVEVQSVPGQGTTFSFDLRLPLDRGSTSAGHDAP